ncbi:MAG: sulfatase [Pirellulales bacterium]|nr:sulfatase [Pirellulales bacterium]
MNEPRRVGWALMTGNTAAILGLCAVLVWTTAAMGADPPARRPNIVFILIDDLGQHQLGCYGSRYYETPRIDRLAEQAMRFTDAYSAGPVCSPTRASIMTGKYPARLHLTNYIGGRSKTNRILLEPEWTAHLPLEEVTIAEVLQKAGYATGHFGKWHLNKDKEYAPGRPGDPGSQGFDEVLTTHKPGKGSPSPHEEDWHHVRQIIEQAVAFLEKHRDRPFFCYISHNSIHDPEIEKKALIQKYADHLAGRKSGRNNPRQAAMLETLDASIGTVLAKLDELKLTDKTIVVFFSDNGQKGPKKGKPFRGSKGDLYEGGIRMPLLVRWPGVTRAGSVCGQVVTSTDFFPTLCEAVGVSPKIKGLDGVSLVPVLKDQTARLDREAVYWHFPHYRSKFGPHGAIRQGRYKLVEWFEKSIDDEPGGFELYDLQNDPREQHDLAATKPELTRALTDKLRSWRKRVGAQEMRRNPAWNPPSDRNAE